MILKGSTISGTDHARNMAEHLFKDENEKIFVREIPGAQDRKAVEDMLVDMHQFIKATKAKKHSIFHVAINPREHETLTSEQAAIALARIEKEFELEGQLRFQVDHIKDKRFHTHVFWSAVDMEKKKLKELDFYKLRLQNIRVGLEEEFGHEITPTEPSETTLEVNDKDRMIENRTKEKAIDRKLLMTALWNQTKQIEDFISAVQAEGYDIAKGDRCRFAVLDGKGNTFNLVRDLPKTIKTKQVKERFGEYYDQLLSVQETLERMQERIKEQEQQTQEAEIEAREEPPLDAYEDFDYPYEEYEDQPEPPAFDEPDRGTYPDYDQAPPLEAYENTEYWDSDRANADWEQGIIDAAIASEKKKTEQEKAYFGIGIDEAAKRGMDHFMERQCTVSEQKILRHVASNSDYTVNEVKAALKKSDEVLSAQEDKKTYLTTREAVQTEEAMIAYAKDGKDTQEPLNADYEPQQDFLERRSKTGH